MQIQMPGLASGLDSTTLIQQLLAIDRQPRNRIADQQALVKARQQALKDVETRMRNLQNSTADLRSALLFLNTQTVESSDQSKLGVTRTGGVGPGVYQVVVTQTAAAEQRTYGYSASASPTTIAINGHSTAIAANATLDDVVAAINGDGDARAFAANVNGSLVLSSKKTGATGPGGGAALQVTAGQLTETAVRLGKDAIYSVDGVGFTNSSNTIADAVPGLTLTLKGTTTGVNVTVGDPGPDLDAIKSKLQAFVDQYNSTVSFVQGKLTEKVVEDKRSAADVLAGKSDTRTDSEKAQGSLHNDSMLVQTLSKLRQMISAPVPGQPLNMRSLADIGITTGKSTGSADFSPDAVAGKLQLDTDKLTAALKANPAGVRSLLGSGGGPSGTGFTQLFSAVLDPIAQRDGTLDDRIASAGREITTFDRQMANWDVRLKLKEDSYNAMFTRLETAMSKAQQQQQWLSGQLAALNK